MFSGCVFDFSHSRTKLVYAARRAEQFPLLNLSPSQTPCHKASNQFNTSRQCLQRARLGSAHGRKLEQKQNFFKAICPCTPIDRRILGDVHSCPSLPYPSGSLQLNSSSVISSEESMLICLSQSRLEFEPLNPIGIALLQLTIFHFDSSLWLLDLLIHPVRSYPCHPLLIPLRHPLPILLHLPIPLLLRHLRGPRPLHRLPRFHEERVVDLILPLDPR